MLHEELQVRSPPTLPRAKVRVVSCLQKAPFEHSKACPGKNENPILGLVTLIQDLAGSGLAQDKSFTHMDRCTPYFLAGVKL